MTTDSLAEEGWITIAQADAAESGDCVRVMSQSDGRALFFLGDVAGHDARAAQRARELDVRVSVLARRTGPGALLTILNGTIEACWPADLFVSAVCFSLDLETGRGSLAAAGQLPPVVRRMSSSCPVDVAGGPPLGVFAEHGYLERPFTLAAGDLLVAVTDGVTDPLAIGQDPLGFSALCRIVDRAASGPSDVCAALLCAARRAGLHDDATVLAVAPLFRAMALASPPVERLRLAA